MSPPVIILPPLPFYFVDRSLGRQIMGRESGTGRTSVFRNVSRIRHTEIHVRHGARKRLGPVINQPRQLGGSSPGCCGESETSWPADGVSAGSVFNDRRHGGDADRNRITRLEYRRGCWSVPLRCAQGAACS